MVPTEIQNETKENSVFTFGQYWELHLDPCTSEQTTPTELFYPGPSLSNSPRSKLKTRDFFKKKKK